MTLLRFHSAALCNFAALFGSLDVRLRFRGDAAPFHSFVEHRAINGIIKFEMGTGSTD